jgi:hypothetical protein
VKRFHQAGRALVAALLLGCIAPVLADYPLTIIDLHHQVPEALIPQLAPLAGPDGVVTGARDVLMVRASPQRLADIRRALEYLDRPARNLLVEVRSSASRQQRERGIAVTVDESVGSNGRIVLGPPQPGGGSGIQARNRSYRDERDVLQQVRVLDGGNARIQTGTTTPVPVYERGRTRDGFVGRSGVVGIDTGTGFTVTPRLRGNQVIVDIDQRSSNFSRGLDDRFGRDSISGGGLQTQVSGPLGSWIPLGGSTSRQDESMRGLSAGGNAAASGLSGLELRVTAVD